MIIRISDDLIINTNNIAICKCRAVPENKGQPVEFWDVFMVGETVAVRLSPDQMDAVGKAAGMLDRRPKPGKPTLEHIPTEVLQEIVDRRAKEIETDDHHDA